MKINLSPVLQAALWMMGTLSSFMAMAIAGRELSVELSTFQILFFRSLVGLVVVAVLLTASGWGQLRTRRLGLHVLRNAVHLGGQFGWFFGIALIPLAQVFAIEFTTPIWTAILAIFVLGERPTLLKFVAIGLGFLGILIILRPGATEMGVGLPAFAVLAGAMGYAGAYVFTKMLGRSESPLSILFYMTVLQLPFALVPSIPDWTMPSAALWPAVILVGMTGLSAHYCMVRALALADASVVVPMDFLRLPLITVIGFVYYGEAIEIWVLLGGLVIFLGNFINVRAASAAGGKD